jgi:hypothetical protein
MPANRMKISQAVIVYCPTSFSVLPNKEWCTPQQPIVYSLTNFGVLPNKK